ncbi:hypothetical protein TWF730_001559 [Orbilia blumenaviensis]|uniref:Uncharacterized protein n=1 Tax=Orbilia blumenaviensis TaxID=1796055 RepID=A0AAV9UL50_9PEZI
MENHDWETSSALAGGSEEMEVSPRILLLVALLKGVSAFSQMDIQLSSSNESTFRLAILD